MTSENEVMSASKGVSAKAQTILWTVVVCLLASVGQAQTPALCNGVNCGIAPPETTSSVWTTNVVGSVAVGHTVATLSPSHYLTVWSPDEGRVIAFCDVRNSKLWHCKYVGKTNLTMVMEAWFIARLSKVCVGATHCDADNVRRRKEKK